MFLGTSAVDAELGVWDSTMVEVPIKRAMIAAAETVTLLADSAKFSMAGMIWVTDARSLDAIVTDAPVPPQCDDAVGRFGVEVTVT